MRRSGRWPMALAVMLLVVPVGFMTAACGGDGKTSGDADADEAAPDPQEEELDVAPPDTPAEPDLTSDPTVEELPDDVVEEDGIPDPDVVEDAEDEDTEDAVEEADAGCVDPFVYHPAFDICVSTEHLGRNCAGSVECEQGQECVEYYGIAGNPFYECYIVCGPTPDRLCPEGTTCTDYSDGPQNICE